MFFRVTDSWLLIRDNNAFSIIRLLDPNIIWNLHQTQRISADNLLKGVSIFSKDLKANICIKSLQLKLFLFRQYEVLDERDMIGF